MGKRQVKQMSGWSCLAMGVVASMGVYLTGIFLMALFLVNGIIADEKNGLALSVWAMISTACGSVLAMKIKRSSPLSTCLIQGGACMLLILVVSYLGWEGPVWNKTNAALLICILAGGLLPGVLTRGKKKRKYKHAW